MFKIWKTLLKYINKTLETTHQICKIGAEQFQKDQGPFRW